MSQSIVTKWLGYTNTKGLRIKALANKRMGDLPEMSLTVPYEYDGGPEGHADAAKALATRQKWYGVWIAGGSPDHNGFVFVKLDGSFSRDWCDKYLCGIEGRDWFIAGEGL